MKAGVGLLKVLKILIYLNLLYVNNCLPLSMEMAEIGGL